METQNNPLDQRFVEMQNTDAVLTPATSGKRFINSLLDTLIIYVLFIALLIGIGFIAGVDFIQSTAVIYLVYFFSFFLYYVTMENANGKTFGKMVTKTQVFSEDGKKPSLSTIFKRTLCRLIPFEALTFFGSKSGMHDRLSKTVVTSVKPNV